ncbi:MAG: hypothetical protein JXL84_08090 [Deltaproteobacteria bacterium]|nr:hypothetical protein [Deltaproteobacteria bacterium]
MKCAYHAEREAVAECSKCGKVLCAECAIPHGEGKTLCSRCIALVSAEEAATGMDQRLEEKEARKRSREEKKDRMQRWWFLAQWAMIGLGLAVMAFQAPRVMSGFEGEKPVRIGTYETDAATDQCISNLWRVTKLLQEGKPPGQHLVCPESKRPYVVTRIGSDTVVRCPNPEKHGFKEIRASKNRPVPEVIP